MIALTTEGNKYLLKVLQKRWLWENNLLQMQGTYKLLLLAKMKSL